MRRLGVLLLRTLGHDLIHLEVSRSSEYAGFMDFLGLLGRILTWCWTGANGMTPFWIPRKGMEILGKCI
jgi:hypothetical protein